MEFVEGFFDEDELHFFDALNYLEALDYDSDQYWYSGSEDYYGSDIVDSDDWNNSELLDSDELGLLGCILNDQFTSWKHLQFDADDNYFPVTFGGDVEKIGEPSQVFPSLMDLSAQVVSRHLPYSYIQRIHVQIPELVAKKIMLYSFPRHVSDIYTYWLNPLIIRKGSNPDLKDGCHVERIDQFGFCVQGQVTYLDETHTASLICDRCIVTTVSCSCKKEGMLWCRHVVALAVCRIHHASTIQVHLPVFDSISKLNRDQLQKLLQYLTCDGHLPVLKSLQDEVSLTTLEYSLTEEIEDITAPTICEVKPKWFLEPFYCKDISFPFFILLLRKALKMCKGKDSNGICILKALLYQIPSPSLGRMDKIITALISVISSPILSDEEKEECCTILKDKQSNHITPDLYDESSNDPFDSLWRNNINYISCKRTKLSSAAEKARRSVFYMPLASIDLSWKDKNLRRILSSDLTLSEVDLQGLCWFEHFPTSCARIEVLFNNGYEAEAIRLAVVIAKSVILQVKKWKIAWINALHDGSLSYTKSKVQQLMASAGESWLNQTMILHKIDPVAILFSSLTNASQILKHVCKDNPLIDESEYMQLAVEAIIVILSQQLFPKMKSSPDLLREYHRNEIIWLRSVLSIVLPDHTSDSSDETEVSLTTKWKPDADRIRDLFKLLAEAGPFTVFGSAGDYFIPRYQWGHTMVSILYHIDRNLAVEVGLKCLKYPIDKIANSDSEDEYTYDHIKLVTSLLLSHDGDSKATDEILDTADYIKNACKSMLFLKESKAFIIQQQSVFPEMSTFTKQMIFKRLLKALKSEKKRNLMNSGVCVMSLLGFAATIGYETVVEILTNWSDLFDISRSIEILRHCDWAEAISGSLHKNQTHLANVIYSLTLQCVASEIVEDHLKFNALLEVQKTFQFTEMQKQVLADKTFSLGISLSAVVATPDVLYTTLSRLVDDDAKRTSFKNFVSEAIKKNKVSPQQLFLYSQQEQAENINSAFNLGMLAVQNILILPNCKYGGIKVKFETNCIVDVFRLAINLGESEVAEIMSSVINNVKHDAVLCDLTKIFHAIVIEKNAKKPEWLEKFIIDVMGILQQSLFRRSRRLRNEVKNFINNLKRTRTIYLLANDGWSHFSSLLSHLKPLLPQSKRSYIFGSIGLSA